ncbi:hypothetical protein [Vibrio methylphosphonaticus]|uniref:hypothetical protein n=1 Tax=Vibrio methylphosphonaticus TaxID=2946866 RepID=UPI002029FE59|nr:hypothetical protein [Vibrio methylphosphonaticus]MCL9777048.1 hypothetical protein [Vibrio methylphosphonaticus]
MNQYIISAVICITLVLGIYGYQFHSFQISNDVNHWGQFGGFMGGVLGPLLSFLSYVMLIKSLSLQNDANSVLKEESKLNIKNEKMRSFEVHFFNLINAQRDSFEYFKLEPQLGEFLTGVSAVRELENQIENMRDNNANDNDIAIYIKNIDSHEKIYNTQRIFYVITKMISQKLSDENGFTQEERQAQLTTLINFTELSALRITLISMQFLSHKSSKLLREDQELIDIFKELKLPYDQY